MQGGAIAEHSIEALPGRSASDGHAAPARLGRREARQLQGGPERRIGLRHLVWRLHGAAVPRGALQAGHGRRHRGGRAVGLRRHSTWVAAAHHGHASLLPYGGEWPAVPRPPNLAASIAATKDAARAGHLDPTTSLANAKAFLFSGTMDSLEPQPVMDELYQYYLAFSPPGNVRYVNNVPAEHAMVTDRYGNACGHLGPPYINNCGYDTAGEMLKFIYGGLEPPGDPATGKLLAFDQSEFLPIEAISMAPAGHVFVPADCQAAPGCRLHVAFHGCLQSQQLIGDAFYAQVGYNRWAATNRIIVLYPQAAASDIAPFNPNGCWDWFAYTDSRFATRSGLQIVAVRKMIARLSDGAHH